MANSLLEEIQKRMGGEFALGQQELANQYANKPGGGIPLEAYARQVSQQLANEEAEAIERNAMQNGGSGLMASYDQDPLGQTRRPVTDDGELRAITPPRPLNARTGLPMDTVGDVVYDYASKLGREPEDRVSQAMNFFTPTDLAKVFRRGISDTEENTKMDLFAGALDAGFMGAPKLIKNFTMNLRNFVKGFYGPNPIPGVIKNAGMALKEGSQNMARKLYSASEVPVATRNVLREEMKNYKAFKKLGDEGGYTEEIIEGMRAAVRKMDGQVAQNILHSKMMANFSRTIKDGKVVYTEGKIPNALKPYNERRFGYEMPFDRELAEDMFDDVDAKMIYDMSLEAWTGKGATSLSGGAFQGPTTAIFLNKKNTQSAGDSLSDVGRSRQMNVLKSLKVKKDPQTAEEWKKVLDEYDSEWNKKLGMSIKQGTDGVFFQFSPAGRRDYLLGGFNAVVKVKNDGTLKMFGTDKQDIFGQKIPGSADGIVGIGTRPISILGKNNKELAIKPTPRYTGPPRKKPDTDVTVESAKKSQGKLTKVEKRTLLPKEDEKLFNAILSDANTIAGDRIAITSGGLGLGASLNED